MHIVLLPAVILLTAYLLGSHQGLTPLNQSIWSPLVGTQLTLASLFFVLAATRFAIRAVVFVSAVLLICLAISWTWSFFGSLDPLKLSAVLRGWPAAVSLIAPNCFAVGVMLFALRPMLGKLEKATPQQGSRLRYQIRDYLVLMMGVAFMLTWSQAAVSLPGMHASQPWLICSQVLVATGSLASVALIAFSDHHRWIGVAMWLVAAAVGHGLLFLNSPNLVSAWSVVPGLARLILELATLRPLRLAGYRLVRPERS